MTRLNWAASGARYFENGVDRGVLFVNSGTGVPWTGLISVAESPTGGEARAFYQDGIKYLNLASSEEYEATISAFSAPPEFGVCDGVASIQNGLFATQQPRKAFGFSYRTMIGNDTEGKTHGYKIHLVYNALAAPSSRNNESMGSDVSPDTLSWQISTLPPSLTGRKPTAHFVIDSRYTPKGLLAHIEDILYGSESMTSRLPMPSELVALFQSEGPVTRRNYVFYPSFRYTTGEIEVFRNIAQNPAMRRVNGRQVVRTNLAKNPRYVGSAGNLPQPNDAHWSVTPALYLGGIGNTGVDTGIKVEVINASGAGNAVASIYNVDGNGDLATVRGLSVWVFSPVAAHASIVMTSGENTRGTFAVPANVWTEIRTAVPGSGHTTVGITKDSGVAVVGDYAYITAVTAEAGYVPRPDKFFDGNKAADSDFNYGWTGAVNASTSTADAPWLEGGQGPTFTYQVFENGRYWQKIWQGNYHYAVGAPTTVGKYYACQLRIRGNPGDHYGIDTSDYVVGSICNGTQGDFPASGEVVINLSSRVPTAGTGAYVGFNTAGVVAGSRMTEIFWQEVDGPNKFVTGAYFDGSTPDADGLDYRWTGAVDQSISAAVGKKLPTLDSLAPPASAHQSVPDGQGGYFAEIRKTGIAYLNPGPGVIGEYWAASAIIGPAPDTPPGSLVRFTIHDGTNYVTGTDPQGNDGGYMPIPEVPTRVVAYSRIPLTNTAPRVYIYPQSIDGPVRVAQVIMEKVSGPGMAPGPFFDGSTPDENANFYAWDGAPDIDTSRLNTWN